MDTIIFNALKYLFDSSLIGDAKDWMGIIMNGLSSVFQDQNVVTYFSIFSAAGASLMIIFFFIDIMDSASKDMVTFERLVLSFVKLLLGFCIMFYLPELLQGLFSFINFIYQDLSELAADKVDFGLTYFGQKEFPESMEALEELTGEKVTFIEDGSLKDILLGNFGAFFTFILLFLATFASKFVVFMVTITNAISMVTRAIFAPLAVAQCFEDGQKSNAIKYLKKFAADGITFAIVVGMLYAASVLQGNIVSSVLASIGEAKEITVENAMLILGNMKVVASIIVISVSVVGATFKASSMAQDIVGAH